QRSEIDFRISEEQALLFLVVEFVEGQQGSRRPVRHRIDEGSIYRDGHLGKATPALEHGGAGYFTVHDEIFVPTRVDDTYSPFEWAGQRQTVGLEQLFARAQLPFRFDLGFAAWRVVKQGG